MINIKWIVSALVVSTMLFVAGCAYYDGYGGYPYSPYYGDDYYYRYPSPRFYHDDYPYGRRHDRDGRYDDRGRRHGDRDD